MPTPLADRQHRLSVPFYEDDIEYIRRTMAEPNHKSLGATIADLVHDLVRDDKAAEIQ